MKPNTAIRILLIVYAVGLAGFLIPATEQLFSGLTAGTILFSFIFLMFFHSEWNFSFVLAALVIALSGFLVEYIGVQTGWVFGRYSYGSNLGIKIYGIPLLKGINWLMLIYCSRAIVQKITSNGLLSVVAATLLMLVYDYFLEQFAIHYNLWTWNTGTPPLHNFIGWFVVSLLIHSVYRGTRKQVPNPLALTLFLLQVAFFAVIGIVKGWIPYMPAF